MLASREAAVGIQRRCIRQRITCAVLRAQADVLLGRMKYALPGWAQVEARREGQAEAHCAAQAQAEDSGGFRGGRRQPTEQGDPLFRNAASTYNGYISECRMQGGGVRIRKISGFIEVTSGSSPTFL